MAQPMVDGLERELAGRARVVRLNVAEPVGAEAQARFQTTKVPTSPHSAPTTVAATMFVP